MLSHNVFSLCVNEGFVTFFTSNIFTCFIDGFTSKMKSQSMAYLLSGTDIYIEFWTLKMKCTQYGLYGQKTFKNAKAILFFRSQAKEVANFTWDLKILDLFYGGCPKVPDCEPQSLSTCP